MTSVEELIAELSKQGIKIWTEGEHLKVNSPNGVITDKHKKQISQNKQAIIEFLAEYASISNGTNSIPRADRKKTQKVSFNQQRLWPLLQIEANGSAYNIPFFCSITGPLDIDFIGECLAQLTRRHELLRAQFILENSEPKIYIQDKIDNPITIYDLSSLGSKERQSEVENIITRQTQYCFSPLEEVLWSCHAIKLANENFILGFVFHHLIFDGESKSILLKEFSSIYSSLCQSSPAILSHQTAQYLDYALWHSELLKSEQFDKLRGYWQQKLKTVTATLSLPVDKNDNSSSKQSGKNVHFPIDSSHIQLLKKAARKSNVTLPIVLLAAFHILLERYTGQQDQLICLPVACRNHSAFKSAIGYFNNIVVIRNCIKESMTFIDAIGLVRKSVLEANEHEEFPFQWLSEFPELSRIPLNKALFSYRNAPENSFSLCDLICETIEIENQTADFDLALYIRDNNGLTEGVIRYKDTLFKASTIDSLVKNYINILTEFTLNLDVMISTLPLQRVSTAEIEKLIDKHPKVSKAAVSDHNPLATHSKVAAFIVAAQDQKLSPDELREYLENRLPAYLIPSRFIQLDALPQDKSGAINYSALPVQLVTNIANKSLPRSPLEKKLVAIWSKAFWLDEPIGIEDDFFELGGHSLLSAQLITEMEALLERKLPLEIIRNLGTIKSLVDTMEDLKKLPNEARNPTLNTTVQQWLHLSGLEPTIYHGLVAKTAAWKGWRHNPLSLITGRNIEGQEPPLFWCFQGHFELSQLAQYLGEQQPIYGMRSGNQVMEKNKNNIAALAHFYALEIISIYPKGPFIIGGNCQSAKISFLIAKVLLSKGYHVPLLITHEQFIAEPYPEKIALIFGNESNNNPFNFFPDAELAMQRFYGNKFSVDRVPGAHGEFFLEPNIQFLAKKIRELLDDIPNFHNEHRTSFKAPALELRHDDYTIRPPKIIRLAPSERCIVRATIVNHSSKDLVAKDEFWINAGWRCYKKNRDCVLNSYVDENKKIKINGNKKLRVSIKIIAPTAEGRFHVAVSLIERNEVWPGRFGENPCHIEISVRRKFWYLYWLRKLFFWQPSI